MTPPDDTAAARAKPARRRFRNGVLNDFPLKLPNETFEVIFDIGANVGQSAVEFTVAYPEARIWSFEPIAASFAQLAKATAELQQVTASPYAIGRRPSVGHMKSVGTSTGNRMLVGRVPPDDSEEVQVINGDAFCAEHGIERIDYLKVDTEGFDLQVLIGFQRMLADEAINVVQVESSMYANNPRHVPLDKFRGYLEPMGYHLFGLYGQARDFRGLPVLSRVDPIFISTPVIERNTVVKRK